VATPKDAKRPKFWIVAGPNGSGKSSAYENAEIEEFGGTVWIINPDILTLRIAEIEKIENPNLAAVERIERWLEASIHAHQTIGVETVLSTDKYRRLVRIAKELRFEIILIYVILNSANLNVERVKMRVAKGGHGVSEDKIRSRYDRSLQQLPWFLNEADRAWLYDNSGAKPRTIGLKAKGVLTLDPDAIPAIKAAAETIRSA
jgi:predicted ABC-type ATPase